MCFVICMVFTALAVQAVMEKQWFHMSVYGVIALFFLILMISNYKKTKIAKKRNKSLFTSEPSK